MNWKYKRCGCCGILPLPTDIAHHWGTSPEDLNQPLCLRCRGKVPQSLPRIPPPAIELKEFKPVQMSHFGSRSRLPAVVVFIRKFIGLEERLLSCTVLGNPIRDALRMRQYNTDVFLTDGERIWKWTAFPENRNSPLDWDKFLELWPDWELYAPDGSNIKIVAAEEHEHTLFAHVKM